MKHVLFFLALVLAVCAAPRALAATTNVIVNVTGNNNTDVCNETLLGKTSGFQIESYSIGGTNPGSSNPGSSPKLSLSDLVIAKTFDSCSGELVKDFLTEKTLTTVTLYDYRPTGQGPGFDFLTITLSDVVIASYQLSDTSTATPQESISLSYAKVCIADTPQNSDGSPGATAKVCYSRTGALVQ